MTLALVAEVTRQNLERVLETVRHPSVSPDEVREMYIICQIATFAFEKNWQQTEELISQGVEVKKLSIFVKEFSDVLKMGDFAFRKTLEKIEDTKLTPQEKQDCIRTLEQSAKRAQEILGDLEALLRNLELPNHEVDTSTLPPGGESQHVPGYISSSELFSRMRERSRSRRMA